jgi:hypothetical protein
MFLFPYALLSPLSDEIFAGDQSELRHLNDVNIDYVLPGGPP